MGSPRIWLCPSPLPAAAEPGPGCVQRCSGGEHALDQKGIVLGWLPNPWGQEVASWLSITLPTLCLDEPVLISCGPFRPGCRYLGQGSGSPAHLGLGFLKR